MSKVKVKISRKGVRELLQSQEMVDICKGHADETLMRLGDGYEVTTHVGKNRCNASIRATTRETIMDSIANNTIIKAMRK